MLTICDAQPLTSRSIKFNQFNREKKKQEHSITLPNRALADIYENMANNSKEEI